MRRWLGAFYLLPIKFVRCSFITVISGLIDGDQIILAQKARDDHIRSLLNTMSDTFSCLKDVGPLEEVEMLKPTILLMAQQTMECAYYIRDYAKDSYCNPFFL